jgi:hypothetical protein
MGVYRVDGGRGTPSSGAVPAQPSTARPATFAQAVQNARTATEQATSSNDPKLFQIADMNWGIVQEWEENDYRLAAQSADPKTEMAALDTKFGAFVPDNGVQKKIFEQINVGAKKTVAEESPEERQFQLDLYKKQGKVAETYDALQSAPANDNSAAYTNYTTAVKDLINFQLRHELSKLTPAGPNASYTLAQWQQAGDKVKALPGVSKESAQLIDTMAKVNGYTDEIQYNRAGLKLTPGEEELANKDPVMLAFVKAAGFNLDDPKLSPEMKQIATTDPQLFVMFKLSGGDISTSETPVDKDDLLVGQIKNGLYLHVTVKDTAIVDPTLLSQLVPIYNGFDAETRPLEVAKALVPALQPEKNEQLQSLMLASDAARTEYGTKQMKALTSGANPDGKAILAFMTTQLNGYFDSGARKAYWEANGKPFFTQDYFRKQFDQVTKKPDSNSAKPEDIRELQSTETKADKIGRYMQEVLKNAPQEVADDLLDTVKSSYRADWEPSNQSDPSGLTSRYEEFYKALSMAVELSPGRAEDITKWLMDRSGPQGVILIVLWDDEHRQFEGLKDTITEGYGPTLSLTLLDAVKKSRDHQNMKHDLEMRFNQGWTKVQDKYARKVNKQDYDEIMKDVDKYLKPFFQSFLGDKNIGNPVDIKNETQLHNMIGKVLGLAPTNTEAAKKLDYTQEWYSPDTADWNKIILVTKMINDQIAELRKEHGNRAYTINALPGKYISERDGTQLRALFIINLEGVNADEWIDPQAALNAVALNGGKEVKWDDLHGKWHYDDFHHFQVDNPDDDDGFLYLPTNFRLGDSDNDGKISPADYHQEAAAITTGGERAQTIAMTGLAVVGVVGLFIPGANVVVATAMISAGILGAGIAGVELYKLGKAGKGWSSAFDFSDPEARMHWLNIAGSGLAFGRMGMLSTLGPASKFVAARQATASLMGAGSTYIGVNLTAMQGLHLAQTWDDPTISGWEKVVNVAGVASGGLMIGLSGMQVKPWKGASNPVKDFGGTRVASARQTGAYAFKQWLANKMPSGGIVAQLWKTSHDTFLTKIGEPAYQAYQKWAQANPGKTEAWWDSAKKDLQTKIDAKAQDYAGKGNTRTAIHFTKAEEFYAEQLGQKAFEYWVKDGTPKSSASPIWSKAVRVHNRQTSWTGYQLWRSEQAFIKQVGEGAYDAHLASVKAGNAPEAWWTDAIASYRAQIDAKAQAAAGTGKTPTAKQIATAEASFARPIGLKAYELWNTSHSNQRPGVTLLANGKKPYAAYVASVKAGGAPEPWWTDAIATYQPKIQAKAQAMAGSGKTVTPQHLADAEASFARPIGVEAYKLWNTTYKQTPSTTMLDNGKVAKPGYVYKGWAKTGSLPRLTTKSDDVVLWATDPKRLQTKAVTTPSISVFGKQIVGPKTIGQVTLWRGPRVLKQSPTDVTVWTGAERVFKIRIGTKRYNEWKGPLIKKAVGMEDTYFNAANTHYANEIATSANRYFEDPSLLGKRLTPRVDKGASGEFWSTIKTAAQAWVADGMPTGLRHWKQALANPELQAKINAHAYDLWQVALKTNPAATKDQFIPAAREYYSYDIAESAFTHWTVTRSSSAKYAANWKVANDALGKSEGTTAYNLWSEAGFPDGRRNAPWVAARRDVVGSQGYTFRRAGQWGKDLINQWRIRGGDRGGAYSKVGWKQGWSQMVSTAKFTGKWYARAYVGINALGVIGYWTFNHWVKEDRRDSSGAITSGNAPVELQKLLDDKNYVENNYDQWSLIPIQANGHLMAYITPDGKIEYFRRIPGDLYQTLDKNPKAGGVKPWILDTRTNQQANTQVFEKDGRLYVYETIKLDAAGNYPYSEADLLKTDPAALPDEIKEQIGVRAYWEWVQGGRLQGTAGASLWGQAELDFRTQTGQQAYNAWATTPGKPKTGDNVYWDDGVKAYQQQIDTEAETLWKADTDPNKSANFRVAKYLNPAEKKYGAEIATNVYARWNQGGRNPNTLGVQQWNAGEPAFQEKLGIPAFNAWVDAGRSTTADNAVWGTAVTKWDADGKPIMQQVEIRAPYRIEGNTDVRKPHTSEDGHNLLGDGSRHRFNWGWGPIEGWRIHANLEGLWNYRYNIPTTTTFRIGGPSPTQQGWSWDLRQQDTTMWTRFNLSVGTIEYNGAQVYDLTENSRDGWTVMNTRIYTDIGNRNRMRLDGTGRYLRFRETVFVEMGLGADFYKRTTAEGAFNINGYYELQLYGPDFRSQVNMTGTRNKDLGFNNTRGLEAFPLLGIDPAFQISWTSANQLRVADIPVLSSDNS